MWSVLITTLEVIGSILGIFVTFFIIPQLMLEYSELKKRDRTAHEILMEWTNKQGHNRCWYYPDLYIRLCNEFGIREYTGPRVPKEEFKAGCEQFQNAEYSDQDFMYI